MKNARCFSYIVLAAITIAITALTIGASFSPSSMARIFWFHPIMNAIVFGALAIASLIGIFFVKPGISIYKVSFYALHIGVVLFLVGMLMFSVWGEEVTQYIPMGPRQNQDFMSKIVVKSHNGEPIDTFEFDFHMRAGLRMEDFFIEPHPNGKPKQFHARIEYAERSSGEGDRRQVLGQGQDADGTIFDIVLAGEDWISVNNPIRKNGVKIYLMSFTSEGYEREDGVFVPGEWLLLHFKKDPGEIVSVIGIYILLIGSVGMCIVAPAEKELRRKLLAGQLPWRMRRLLGPEVSQKYTLALGGTTAKKKKSAVVNCPQCNALNRLYPDVENLCVSCNRPLDYSENGGKK